MPYLRQYFILLLLNVSDFHATEIFLLELRGHGGSSMRGPLLLFQYSLAWVMILCPNPSPLIPPPRSLPDDAAAAPVHLSRFDNACLPGGINDQFCYWPDEKSDSTQGKGEESLQ